MLPVPFEYPLVPVVQYDPMVPPCIPSLSVRPSVQHILPMICSAVCNEAGMRSVANAARLFCYNLLVNNHWHNDHFSEVVKLTADIVAKNYEKGHLRMPESGVQEAANQVLILYTSSLLFLYPDMKAKVSPQILDAAFQNVPTFNNLKQEIFNMHNHPSLPYGHPQPQGYPQGPGMQPMQQYPVQGMPQQYQGGMPPGMHPGMVPGGISPQQQFMMQQQQQAAMMQQQQMMAHQQAMMQQAGGGYPQPPQQQPQQSWANSGGNGGNSLSNNTPGAVVDSVRQDRFFTRTMGNPQPEPVTQPPVQQPPPQPATQPIQEPVMKQENLEIEKGSEMERAKHQITFMGDMYSMDSLARSTQYQSSVEKMAEEVATDGRDDSFCVQESIVMTSSLEEAIVSGRMEQHKRHKDYTDFSTFRQFVSVNPPVFSNQEISSYMKALSKSTSFATMVVKMKSMASSLESKKKDEAAYTVSVISFLKQIDNTMTKLVNNFLSTKLRLKLSIDSFVEDAGELDMYLLKKYGQVVAQGFSKFETETINTIFENNDPAIILGQDLPEGLHVAALSIHHSITYVFMTDRELGYVISEGTVAIQESVAPTLFKIARSLQRHKKEMDFLTLIDVLITADGVRYLISKNYALEEEYLITRF